MNSKEITNILESAYLNDQNAIKDFKAGIIDAKKLRDVNLENIKVLIEILKSYGLPNISSTSKNAYKASVLIALHSENEKLLDQMISYIKNAAADEVEKRDVAYLVDKFRILKNLPQLYGTQFKKSKEGMLEFIEIEDQANLDQRRAELGMESFEDYHKKALLY